MMAKKQAILMIFLVLSLSIYSPLSYAFATVEVTGENNNPNVIKDFDTLQVKVTSDLIENEDEHSVRLIDGSNKYVFNNCASDIGNGTSCYYTRQGFFNPGKKTIFVEILKGSTPIKTIKSYYVVDDKVPLLSLVNFKETKDNLIFDYSVQDQEPCGGLDNLEVYVDGVKRDQVDLQGECFKSDSISISKNTLGGAGLKSVCLYAKDLSGKSSSPVCRTSVRDITPPIIKSISINNKFGQVNHFTNIERNYKLTVNLTTDYAGFSKNLVYADLSQINPRRNYDYEQLNCRQVSDTNWICEKDVRVKTTEEENIDIFVNVTDDSQNHVSKTENYDLLIAKEGAYVDDIYTNHQDSFSGESVFGKKNKIFVSIQSEATINQVFADITSLTKNRESVQGTCSGSPNLICEFNFDLLGSPSIVSVRVYGKDVTDRYFSQTKTFSVDLTKPELNEVYVFPSPPKSYVKNGDNVNIVFNLSDNFAIDSDKVYATFGFISPHFVRQGSCTAYKGYSECTFFLNSVPSADFFMNASFYDVAGNSQKAFSDKFTVVYFDSNQGKNVYNADQIHFFNQELSSAENLWDVSVDGYTPQQIDRQILDLGIPGYTFSIYATLDYSTDKRNADVFSSQVVGCDSPYVEEDDMTIFDVDNNKKILVMPLYDQPLSDLSVLKYSCNISTTSLIGGKNITLPELDEINISIPIYASEIGEIEKNIQKDIVNLKNELNGPVYQTAKKLNDFVESAKEICSYITLMQGTIKTLAYLSDTFFVLSKVPYMGAYFKTAKGFVDKAGTGLDKALFKGKFFTYANKFCLFISCDIGLVEAFGGEKTFGKGIGAVADTWNSVCGQKYDDAGYFEKTQNDFIKILKDQNIDTTSLKATANSNKIIDPNILKNPTDFQNYTQAMLKNIGPKDSLFFSMACMCIPGIVYNVNKYRQIECLYITCLEDTEYGTPKYVCDQIRDYMKCKYVYGEIFNIIPFAPVIDQFVARIRLALQNWGTALATATKVACSHVGYFQSGQPGSVICNNLAYADEINKLLCSLGQSKGCTAFWEQTHTAPKDYCKGVLE